MTTTTTALPHEAGGVWACARRARPALFALTLLGLSGADVARPAMSRGLLPTVNEAPAPDLLAAYIAAVQSDASPAYAITRADRALRAESPAQGFASEFHEDGITLAPRADGARVRLTPARYGCSGALVDLPPATPMASGNRVSYRHELPSADPLVSWYVNGPFGLEQGFTLPSDPCARSGAAARAPGVVLELAIGGGLTATSDEGARGATLRDARGRAVMRYTDLRAIDARGRELSARVEAEGARLALRVDAEGAAYPVTVDPLIWTEQKPITTTNASASFGSALMYEGGLQIIGAPEEDNPYGGAVYVFKDTGPRVTKLVPSDGAPGDHFGASVSVDWSTKTIIVGAPMHDDPVAGEDAGAAYMFTTSVADVWNEVGKLAPTDKLAAGDHFGAAVSVSPQVIPTNGVSRIVVGAPGHDEGSANDAGAAYAFLVTNKPATGTKLSTPAKLVAGDHFGDAVSVAYEQIVVGAPGHNEGKGAAYALEILTTPTTEMIPTLTPLIPSTELALGAGFGSAIASPLTTDAVAYVGAPGDNDGKGAVHVFKDNDKSTPWNASAKLIATNGAPGDRFGAAVSAVGFKAIIGAPKYVAGTSNSGTAYVFSGSSPGINFFQSAQILTDQPGIKEMGSSVFVRDDILIGAPHVGPDTDGISGAALKYTSDGKKVVMRLTPRSESVISSRSAPAIAISGNTAIIGAPLDGDFLDATGAAYVFIRTNEGWTRQARLTASDEPKDAHFGEVVALDGDVAVIGAPDYSDKVSGHPSGAAYVFERAGNTWRRPVKLSAPGPGGNDAFGAAVAVSNGAVFVGAPQHNRDSNALNVGAAYVFKQAEAWSTARELPREDAAAGDRFGAAIAASQARVLVGSPGHAASGAAYLFHSSGADWSLEGTLRPDDPSAADAAINFGAAVALASDLALIGAPDHSDAAITSTGAAYVFRAKSNAWTQEEILHADKSVQSSKFGAALALLGAGSSPGAPTQTIAAIGAPGSTDDEAVLGAAYSFVFDSGHWSKPMPLIRKSGTVSGFGAAVALTPSSVLVSSPQKDMPALGIVYAFGSSDVPNTASEARPAGEPCTTDAECQSHTCAAGVCSVIIQDVSFYSCATVTSQPHPIGGTSLPLATLGGLGLTIAIRRRAAMRRGRSCA